MICVGSAAPSDSTLSWHAIAKIPELNETETNVEAFTETHCRSSNSYHMINFTMIMVSELRESFTYQEGQNWIGIVGYLVVDGPNPSPIWVAVEGNVYNSVALAPGSAGRPIVISDEE